MARWVYPLDPTCPAVRKYRRSPVWDDPYMIESGCAGEFMEEWERKHRARCERCQLHGAENVDIGD